MMRRLMSVGMIGFALFAASTVAAAQSRTGVDQAGRAGVRGDSAWRRADSDSTRAGRGRMGPGGRERAALAGLDLTAQQKDQVKAINKKYADQFKALRESNGKNAGAPSAEARTQMQSIMQRERADLRSVLTPAQQAKFDANVANAAKGRGKHKGDAGRT
jgi:Spy/CpxP family protein refolding chaperone